LISSERNRSVGRSTIFHKFINGNFIEDFDPYFEDCYRKVIVLKDGTSITLNIYDTAEARSGDFDIQWAFWLNSPDKGIIFLYAINDRISFEEVSRSINKVKSRFATEWASCSVVPAILVATKLDLEDFRQVTSSEGENLAKSHDMPFFETSAKTNINIEAAFNEIASRTLLFIQTLPPPKTKKGCIIL